MLSAVSRRKPSGVIRRMSEGYGGSSHSLSALSIFPGFEPHPPQQQQQQQAAAKPAAAKPPKLPVTASPPSPRAAEALLLLAEPGKPAAAAATKKKATKKQARRRSSTASAVPTKRKSSIGVLRTVPLAELQSMNASTAAPTVARAAAPPKRAPPADKDADADDATEPPSPSRVAAATASGEEEDGMSDESPQQFPASLGHHARNHAADERPPARKKPKQEAPRASSRQRFRPLEYWKGERVVYGRSVDAPFEVVVDVCIADDDED